MDVLAADGGDATAVGVLTGIYTRDELEKTGIGERGLSPFSHNAMDWPNSSLGLGCCVWTEPRLMSLKQTLKRSIDQSINLLLKARCTSVHASLT